METKKQTFVGAVQKELQKQIISYIKANPQLSESDVIKLESLRTLNALREANGQLVEFTYMIQSMFNPEMFAIAALDMNQIQSGNVESAVDVFKYHDTINVQSIINNNQDEFNENIASALGDRSIYYAIPIPHRNSWTEKHFQTDSSAMEEEDEEINTEVKSGGETRTFTYKGVSITSNTDINEYGSKLQKVGLFNYESNKSVSHSFPCLLKYYNLDAKTNPKLNQIVKVVGILSYDFPETNEEIETEGMNQDEMYESFDRTSFLYPERFIPRVHVLKSENVSYDSIYAEFLMKYVSHDSQPSSEVQRQQLLEGFTKILGNDSLSAFYMLISLISSVNLTKDDQNYGNIFLNLMNAHKRLGSGAKISDTLKDFLSSILLYSVSVPLTLQYLNTSNVFPVENSSGKIEFGTMQLPKETKHYIVCDETNMELGQLDSKGLSNAKNLISLFEDLKIFFESDYFKGSSNADISGVILSDGKGMLYKDIQIKLEEDLESGAIYQKQTFSFEIIHDEKFLGEMRRYVIESKNRALTVQLDQDVATSIQTDFVEKRKQQAKEHDLKKEQIINQDSLERWIQLCRLNAASKLKQYATLQDYQEIKTFEEKRIHRAMKVYN